MSSLRASGAGPKPRKNVDPCGIAAAYEQVRARTEALARPLSAEDCALQSMPDASPVKWHLAHTTWFFETFVLSPHADRYRPFDADFRVLFNSYYNGVGDKHPRPERGLISRPDMAAVRDYRAHVDHAHARAARRLRRNGRSWRLIELGLHHEQQHQELILTDVKHLFSRNPARPAYEPRWPLLPVKPAALEWRRHDGGLATIGHRGDGFRVRQRRAAHQAFLEPFELASRPVTHGEFAAFIADGGYRRPELWLSLGWDTVALAAMGGAALLGRARRALVDVHAARHGGDRSARAGVPRQLFRSRRVCALGRRAAADRIRMGARGARRRPSPATSSTAARCIRCLRRVRLDRCDARSSTATSGNGRRRATRPIRGFVRRRARSANTTASSCATSTCCAAARARRRHRTSARRTAISSRPRRAGSSPGFASRATHRKRGAHAGVSGRQAA